MSLRFLKSSLPAPVIAACTCGTGVSGRRRMMPFVAVFGNTALATDSMIAMPAIWPKPTKAVASATRLAGNLAYTTEIGPCVKRPA